MAFATDIQGQHGTHVENEASFQALTCYFCTRGWIFTIHATNIIGHVANVARGRVKGCKRAHLRGTVKRLSGGC